MVGSHLGPQCTVTGEAELDTTFAELGPELFAQAGGVGAHGFGSEVEGPSLLEEVVVSHGEMLSYGLGRGHQENSRSCRLRSVAAGGTG